MRCIWLRFGYDFGWLRTPPHIYTRWFVPVGYTLWFWILLVYVGCGYTRAHARCGYTTVVFYGLPRGYFVTYIWVCRTFPPRAHFWLVCLHLPIPFVGSAVVTVPHTVGCSTGLRLHTFGWLVHLYAFTTLLVLCRLLHCGSRCCCWLIPHVTVTTRLRCVGLRTRVVARFPVALHLVTFAVTVVGYGFPLPHVWFRYTFTVAAGYGWLQVTALWIHTHTHTFYGWFARLRLRLVYLRVARPGCGSFTVYVYGSRGSAFTRVWLVDLRTAFYVATHIYVRLHARAHTHGSGYIIYRLPLPVYGLHFTVTRLRTVTRFTHGCSHIRYHGSGCSWFCSSLHTVGSFAPAAHPTFYCSCYCSSLHCVVGARWTVGLWVGWFTVGCYLALRAFYARSRYTVYARITHYTRLVTRCVYTHTVCATHGYAAFGCKRLHAHTRLLLVGSVVTVGLGYHIPRGCSHTHHGYTVGFPPHTRHFTPRTAVACARCPHTRGLVATAFARLHARFTRTHATGSAVRFTRSFPHTVVTHAFTLRLVVGYGLHVYPGCCARLVTRTRLPDWFILRLRTPVTFTLARLGCRFTGSHLRWTVLLPVTAGYHAFAARLRCWLRTRWLGCTHWLPAHRFILRLRGSRLHAVGYGLRFHRTARCYGCCPFTPFGSRTFSRTLHTRLHTHIWFTHTGCGYRVTRLHTLRFTHCVATTVVLHVAGWIRLHARFTVNALPVYVYAFTHVFTVTLRAHGSTVAWFGYTRTFTAVPFCTFRTLVCLFTATLHSYTQLRTLRLGYGYLGWVTPHFTHTRLRLRLPRWFPVAARVTTLPHVTFTVVHSCLLPVHVAVTTRAFATHVYFAFCTPTFYTRCAHGYYTRFTLPHGLCVVGYGLRTRFLRHHTTRCAVVAGLDFTRLRVVGLLHRLRLVCGCTRSRVLRFAHMVTTRCARYLRLRTFWFTFRFPVPVARSVTVTTHTFDTDWVNIAATRLLPGIHYTGPVQRYHSCGYLYFGFWFALLLIWFAGSHTARPTALRLVPTVRCMPTRIHHTTTFAGSAPFNAARCRAVGLVLVRALDGSVNHAFAYGSPRLHTGFRFLRAPPVTPTPTLHTLFWFTICIRVAARLRAVLRTLRFCGWIRLHALPFGCGCSSLVTYHVTTVVAWFLWFAVLFVHIYTAVPGFCVHTRLHARFVGYVRVIYTVHCPPYLRLPFTTHPCAVGHTRLVTVWFGSCPHGCGCTRCGCSTFAVAVRLPLRVWLVWLVFPLHVTHFVRALLYHTATHHARWITPRTVPFKARVTRLCPTHYTHRITPQLLRSHARLHAVTLPHAHVYGCCHTRCWIARLRLLHLRWLHGYGYLPRRFGFLRCHCHTIFAHTHTVLPLCVGFARFTTRCRTRVIAPRYARTVHVAAFGLLYSTRYARAVARAGYHSCRLHTVPHVTGWFITVVPGYRLRGWRRCRLRFAHHWVLPG